MNPHEFKSRYGHTLQTDPETKQHYIKLPISNLNELAYMHESLLENILLLTQLEKRHYKREQLQSVMYWLCKIVLLSYPHDEINGLTEWLKSE
ncbi:hypothetical protein [Snuella lapsa]|uniref:Uncharacterized protein n=1 Tax=Snuella lapsa TaxID=870481 RepID=A0ABP6WMV6_9FLAO